MLTPGTTTLRDLWSLDPDVAYLNHGSFGATLRSVLALQAELRAEMEREPVEFLGRRLPERMEQARRSVASFLGADPAGLMPVPNASTGVATVLAALDWRADDEVVIADQAYFAVKQACHHLVDRFGVRVRQATIPFPLERPDQVVRAFAHAMNSRTRLVIVDHITSATALVLPVAEVLAEAHRYGVPVLVDGAHGPGHLALSLEALGADFYTGNLHKWCCACKGAAVLHLGPAWRDRVHPLVISHAYGAGTGLEFDWTGTVDPTPWLTAPAAIQAMEPLWAAGARRACHELVRRGRGLLAEAMGVDLPHPDEPSFYAQMAAVPWPGGSFQALTERLYDEDRVEVPLTTYDGRGWVRISAQLYNREEDYQRLADALARILRAA
jgi:isopenicillin-N epimerase